MSEYLEMPWSIEDTIKNLKVIKEAMQTKVILQNLRGRGEKDAEEVAFDFDRAIEALEKQIPKKVQIKPWNPARCPTCNEELSESLGDGYYSHSTFLERCPNAECGQRIQW